MKLVSWNVNGLRACIKKGFENSFYDINADIFCIQETKMQPEQSELEFKGYHQYWNSADKKGYSGTAIFTKIKPISFMYDIGKEEHDHEGRVITLEFDNFYLVNVYTPNSQRGLARIQYRMQWENDFREYITNLNLKKPLILCGDLNVAHNEIDLKNPKSNRQNAGFSDEERGKMDELLDTGLSDSYRQMYPEKKGAYSWWSYMHNARENNSGWRIDYFIVSNRIKSLVQDSIIHSDIMGSDHCPVELRIDL